MTQTEQSEFELVLGNKQLLSVFFIVVVLLAVFFFMGYEVGRSSGTAIASNRPTSDVVRTVPDNGSRISPMPSSAPSAAQQPPASEPQANTPDAQPAAPARTEQAAADAPTSVTEPLAGTTWLQVVATTRADAELIAETLGKRGFKTQVAPAPNGYFRVLVGPAKGPSEVSDLRTRLENAGFKNPIVRKY